MTYRIFGAIDVGSYEVNLKIYELSMKNGIRLLNHVRHRLDLGSDTYATGKIGTELVDELSDAAKLIGACNTVVVKDGKLYGNNTDGMGFVRNLKENGVDVKGKKITVMGAGGAATAIQVQCALDGAKKISIFNRKDEFYANGEKTAKKIQQMVPDC